MRDVDGAAGSSSNQLARTGTTTTKEQVSGVGAGAAVEGARGIGELQQTFGNRVVVQSLASEALAGIGEVVATEVTLDLGGVQDAGLLHSNAAMLRAWRRSLGSGPGRSLATLRPGGGAPLPAPLRFRMQAAFDHDFGHVRIHLDSDAARASRDLDAHAFALGADLFFGPGEWAPHTPAGDRLLAHELTHVVQADEGRIPSGGGVSSPDDALEQEAYANEHFILGRLSLVDSGKLESEPEPDAGDVAPDASPVSGPARAPALGPSGPASPEPTAPVLRDERGSGSEDTAGAQTWIGRSRGVPLPPPVARRLGDLLGHDLSRVRIHVDEAAARATERLEAHAFALGADLFFAPGTFRPDSSEGLERLAHELTHVVQHEEGRLPSAGGLEVSDPGSAAEAEARATAAAVAGPASDVSGDLEPPGPAVAGGAPEQGVAHRDKAAPDAGKQHVDGGKGTGGAPNQPDPRGKPQPVPGQDDQPDPHRGQPGKGDDQGQGDAQGKSPGDGKDRDDKKRPKGQGPKGPGTPQGDQDAGADQPKARPGLKDDTTSPPPVIPPAPAVDPPGPLTLPPLPRTSDQDKARWKRDTGMEPAEHQAKIRTGLGKLSTDIGAEQKTLLALAKTQKTRVDDAGKKHQKTLDDAVSKGHTDVGTAFTDAANKARTAAGDAITAVGKHEQKGLDRIAAVEKKHKGDLKTAYDGAAKGADTLVANQHQPFTQIIKDEADKLKPVGRWARNAAKQRGDELAKKYKPEAKSGFSSLQEDCKQAAAQSLAHTVAQGAEKTILAAGRRLDKRADKTAHAAIDAYTKGARAELDASKKAADTNFDAANTASKQKLTDGKTAATKKIESTRDGIDDRMKKSTADAQEEVNKAEKTLKHNTARSATELKGNIDKKAAADANYYSQLVKDLQARLAKSQRPLKWSEVKPEIDKIRGLLTTNHETHVTELETLTTNGITAYGTTVTQEIETFQKAVTTQQGEAKKWGEDIKGEMNKAARDFGGSLEGIAASHEQTLTDQMKPVQDKAGAFVVAAKAALGKFQILVRKRFQETAKKLKASVTEKLGKIQDKQITNTANKNLPGKKKALGKDAAALRAAMDGMGTDEGKIHKTLRKASYGEIEALEKVYDDHYYKRGGTIGGKYRTPLRYDFYDEMSGSDYKIAINYLNHDRDAAIKLELEDAQGWFNDDEARMEDVLRNCSEKEIKTLEKDHPKVIADVKDCLGGADLDVVNTLLDTSISRDQAKLKADAIRLYDAMDGLGTDEAKVREILKKAKTPEEREKLRAYFTQYSGKSLDSVLKDEFGGITGTGHDLTEVLVLAKVERDQEEVDASKILKAGDGAGTDEKGIFDALKNAQYAGNLDKLDKGIKNLDLQLKAVKDPKLRATLEAKKKALQNEKNDAVKERTDQLDKHIKVLTHGKYQSVDEYMQSEMDGIELQIARQYLKKGKADPELLIRYAVKGAGTDEALVKEALSNKGEPLKKSRVNAIRTAYRSRYGQDLDAVLRGELGGRDLHEVEILLFGKPETPADFKYLADKKYKFENSGVLNGIGKLADDIGLTDTYTDMENQRKRFEQTIGALTPKEMVTKLADLHGKGTRLEELYEYLSQDVEAYGKMKSAVVDALVSALEVIGGVIATIATAGASSPLLAAIIANIVVGATGIVLKKAALGAAYGNDQMVLDTVQMLATSALGSLGEIKAVGKVAESAGKSALRGANKVLGALRAGAEKAGMNLSADAFTMGPKAAKYLQAFVTAGTKNAITSAPGDAVNAAFNDKMWDKGIEDWLGNIASSTIKGVPSAFLSGGAGAVAGDALGKSKSRTGAFFRGSLTSMATNTAAMLGNVDSYKDAGAFWKKMWQSNFKAGLKGGINAAAQRHVLARQTARDLAAGRMTSEQLAEVAPYLEDAELLTIARYAGAKRLPVDLRKRMVDLAYDKYKAGDPAAKSDPSLVALAMHHPDFEAPATGATTQFTPKQKLMIAAKGDVTKLPPDFLGDDVHAAFQGLPAAQKVALAVQLGWDQLPDKFKKTAVAAFGEKRTLFGVQLWHVLATRDMQNAASGNHGKLPPELVAVAKERFASLSHQERVDFAKRLGLDKLDTLPEEIRNQIADAADARVKGGARDPVTMAAAVRLGKVEINDETLKGVAWSNQGKLEFLSLTGLHKEVSDKAKGFMAGALKALKEIGPRQALAFVGSVGMERIPPDWMPVVKSQFAATKANYKLDAIQAIGWDKLDPTMKKATFDALPEADTDKRLAFVHAVGLQNCPASVQKQLEDDLALNAVDDALATGRSPLKSKLDPQILAELQAQAKALKDPNHGLPVNVDTASRDELVQAGFTKKEAGQIIANREANGGKVDLASLNPKARDGMERVRKAGVKPKETPKKSEDKAGPKPTRTTLDVLNDGTEEEIAALPGMDATKAKKIVAHRNKHGEFASLAAVKQVKGVGTKTKNALQGHEKARQLDQLADDLGAGKIKAVDLDAMQGLSDADKIAIAKKARDGGFAKKLPRSFQKALEDHERPDTGSTADQKPDPKDKQPKGPNKGDPKSTPKAADPKARKKPTANEPTELKKVSEQLGIDLDKRTTKKQLKALGFTDDEAGQLLDHIQKNGGIDRKLLGSTHPKARNALDRLATPEKEVLNTINTGTFDELVKLPGIGEKLARRILAQRSNGRVYNRLDDLRDLSKHKVVGDQAVLHLQRKAYLKTNIDKDAYEAYLRTKPANPMDARTFVKQQRQ